MKDDGSEFEWISSSLFQVMLASQPVDVFLIKFADQFLIRDFLDWPDSLPAYILNRVVWDTQDLSYLTV